MSRSACHVPPVESGFASPEHRRRSGKRVAFTSSGTSDVRTRGAHRTGDSTSPERTMSTIQPDSHVDPAPLATAPAPSGQAPAEAGPAPLPDQPRPAVRSTRTGRVWVGVCAAVVIVVALIIFMIQNTHPVEVNFLGM